MKRILPQLTLLGLAALPLTLARAEFDPQTVPADAKWVLHLDVNALRQAPAAKDLIAELEKAKVPIPGGANMQLDVKKVIETLTSVTAYGTTFSKKPEEIDGTLILQGSKELRQMAEGIAAGASTSSPEVVSELKDLPFPAYSIMNQVTVAFPPEAILVVSRSKPQLINARELMRGKRPSLAQNKASALNGIIPRQKNMALVIASVVPDTAGMFPENEPQARLLKMAQSVSLALSSDEKNTAAFLQLGASSEEMADKLLKIVQGLLAMASLAQSSDKDVAQVLQSLHSERHDNTVGLSLALPNELLAKVIKDLKDAQSEQRPRNQPRRPEAPKIPGKIIATWTADQDLGNPSVAPETFVTKTLENVTLKNGSIIILTGQRNDGENARFDSVEISQAGGGFPLRFEAENMRLSHYRAEKAPAASGGRVIITTEQTGNARFEFPGADGLYTIKVRYVDENDGKAVFSVSTETPEPVAPAEIPEAPEAPAAPAAPAGAGVAN